MKNLDQVFKVSCLGVWIPGPDEASLSFKKMKCASCWSVFVWAMQETGGKCGVIAVVGKIEGKLLGVKCKVPG